MTDDNTPDATDHGVILADDKDWTWVLERACPECGFETTGFDRADLGALIRANASDWATILEAPADELRVRPQPDRWSTLEYAVHVRDVFRLFHERLELMLESDDPLFANWDQDVTALESRYNDHDPQVVSVALVAAAVGLSATFDDVAGDTWGRVGRRSDGAVFTVESFGRYLIHDPVHHLWDVRRT
jgi:hypothetical protein